MSSINSWSFYKDLMLRAGVDKINYLNNKDRSLCLSQALIEVKLEEQQIQWVKEQSPCDEIPLPHVWGDTKWGTLQNTAPTIIPNYETENTNAIIIDSAVNNNTREKMQEMLKQQIMMPHAGKRRSAYDVLHGINEVPSEEIKKIVEKENKDIQYIAPPDRSSNYAQKYYADWVKRSSGAGLTLFQNVDEVEDDDEWIEKDTLDEER